MTDEAYCQAWLDWSRVQQLWRRPREEAATKAAHEALDEFLQPTRKPEPPIEGQSRH